MSNSTKIPVSAPLSYAAADQTACHGAAFAEAVKTANSDLLSTRPASPDAIEAMWPEASGEDLFFMPVAAEDVAAFLLAAKENASSVPAAGDATAAPEAERDWLATGFGGLGTLQGGGEVLSAGVGIMSGGIVLFIGGVTWWMGGAGLLIMAAGGAVIVGSAGLMTHGVDTLQANARTVINGQHTDTETFKVAQKAGLGEIGANLTDGLIGIVGPLGLLKILKLLKVASFAVAGEKAALNTAAKAQTAAAAALKSEAGGTVGFAVIRDGTEMKAIIKRADDEYARMLELRSNLGDGGFQIRSIPGPKGGGYATTTYPIPADVAEKTFAHADEALRTQTLRGLRTYHPGRTDGMELVADILQKAGIQTPMNEKALALLEQVEKLPVDDFIKTNRVQYGRAKKPWEQVVPIVNEYRAARSRNIVESATAQGEEFLRVRNVLLQEQALAATAYAEAQAAYNAARADWAIASTAGDIGSIVSAGAHALGAAGEAASIYLSEEPTTDNANSGSSEKD